MKSLHKLTLKMRQIHFNLSHALSGSKRAYKFALIVLYTMTTFLISCTTGPGTSANVETPPPVASPLDLGVGDITTTASGGASSPYAAATVTIEGSVIVISGITNRDDALRGETLTVSIADTDTPANYTAEPSSVTIPANVLNPDGIDGVRVAVPNVAFVLTPVAAGGIAVTFNIELRLDALTQLPPLEVADITIATGSHPAYAAATISSVTGNVVTISGIKNKEDGFNEELTLTIATEYAVTERGTTITGADNALILAGASLNPSGVVSTTTAMDNEGLSFTVTSAGGQESTFVKYYVQLMLGDLIQLKLLSGSAGDFENEVLLSEGTPSSGVTATLKECSIFSFPPMHEVLLGGMSTELYTLTTPTTIPNNPYVDTAGTPVDVSLVLTILRGQSSENVTFSVQMITSAACTETGLSGTGVMNDPYIIDSDRRLELVARLVNANTGTYKSAHYRVTRRIDLGIARAPWSETASGTSGAGFTPIGNSVSSNFSGTFDCDDNEIANLYISRSNTDNVGLFGNASGATIQDCRLVNVDVTGKNQVGGLIGRSTNSTTVSSSYLTGDVKGATSLTPNFGTNVGGLIGHNIVSRIENSYASRVVVSGRQSAGGIVGYNEAGTISTSYVSSGGYFFSSVSAGNVGGGLVGSNVNVGNVPGTIIDSYADIAVTGSSKIGGLVGENKSTIEDSYSIGRVSADTDVGGLVGVNSGTINFAYWDTETSGISGAANDGARSTVQLKSGTVYTAWENQWVFTAGQYPRLKTVVCANRQYNQAATDCTGL